MKSEEYIKKVVSQNSKKNEKRKKNEKKKGE
jgi:hypothetical protein